MSQDHSFYERYTQLAQGGAPFVAVTLVDAQGSTPSDAGAKILVAADGLEFGTVGGGRVEARAIAEAQSMLGGDAPTTRFVEWNLHKDIGMTCGGTVKLYFEAVNRGGWQVVIFGAGHVTQALVRLLIDLPCRVTCIDPREQWLEKLPKSPSLRVVQTDDPPSEVERLPEDAFVLCMTRGHKSDLPVLERIYRTGRRFAYLGVIGSKSKAAVLRRELAEAGIEEAALDFRCPVGLPIGTNHPAEIAVSIAAQLLQSRDAKTT